jgi:hypothetical protein
LADGGGKTLMLYTLTFFLTMKHLNGTKQSRQMRFSSGPFPFLTPLFGLEFQKLESSEIIKGD